MHYNYNIPIPKGFQINFSETPYPFTILTILKRSPHKAFYPKVTMNKNKRKRVLKFASSNGLTFSYPF
jgi:hypothetical protein